MSNLRPTDAFLKRLMAQIAIDKIDEDPKTVKRLTSAQCRFLEAYRRLGVITAACREAKIERTCHYDWCKRLPAYREAFMVAEDEARDEILEACRRVAIDEKNVPMLVHLSRGLFPELFGTQRHEITGADGGSINVKSTSSVEQIFGRINDIISKRQAALDAQPKESRLLAGPEDAVEHSEE